MSTQHTAHSTKKWMEADPRSRPFTYVVLSAYCLLLASGCLHRQLTIRSDPPGAQLMVNDERLGYTPHTKDFLWYGWYRVTLTKDGYEQLEDRVLLKAPPHLWIPLDLLAELAPFPVRDTRELSYTLRPIQPLPEPKPPFPAPETPVAPQPSPTPEDSHGQGG